jgi:chemotaxis response regulator CheB
MTIPIRVLVREMPPLLRGLLETAVSGHEDMELIRPGPADRAAATTRAAPDVVLIGQRKGVSDGRAAMLLSRWPRSVIVEIEVSGRGVRMHELKPEKTEFGEMSPQELVKTICTVVRCKGAHLDA